MKVIPCKKDYIGKPEKVGREEERGKNEGIGGEA